MEKKLIEWCYEYLQQNNNQITSKIIKAKAKEFSEIEEFKASKGWLERIKKKYPIKTTRVIKDKKPAKKEKENK
jgi:hypothetical protein